MAGIGHRGFMGRNKGVIPVPQAGVCTPYPIPIPVTADLIHYSSPFNSCDSFSDYAKTTPMAVSGNRFNVTNDLSGNGNDELSLSTLRSPLYLDDGSGDVYFQGGSIGGNIITTEINPSFVASTTVRTIIILANPTGNVSTFNSRTFGFHSGSNRIWLSVNDGVIRASVPSNVSSSLVVSTNTYAVFSIRFDSNVVVGLDKSYEEVKATPAAVPTSDFNLFSPNEFNLTWAAPFRDIAIYSSSLSDTDLDTMVDYMKAKWNL